VRTNIREFEILIFKKYNVGWLNLSYLRPKSSLEMC
jgi:hypothetical protein